MNTTICPQTQIEFTKKRYNQIYINKQAQIDFNNSKQRIEREKIKVINNVLLKNRRILECILGDQKEVIVSYDYLQGAQYDLRVFSQSIKYSQISTQLIYEFAIQKVDPEKFKIFKIK